MTGGISVGVSGFSYPSWRGRFYPKEAKGEEFLAYYSKHLDTVEINSSFYAPPGSAMVKGWSEKTGEGFKFAFKAPKLITHIKKLGGESVEAAQGFSKTLELLGPKRGPTLFQLPPYAKQDLGLLGDFLSKTSAIEQRVFEFRHESWFDESTYKLLESHEAGFCIVESEDFRPVFKVTGEFAYFRLRNESYDARAIDQWAERISETTKGLDDGYVYLRHDETGENAIFAQKLSEKLRA